MNDARKMINNIYLTKITAAQNEVALSYHRVRVIYSLAIFLRQLRMVYPCNYQLRKLIKNPNI